MIYVGQLGSKQNVLYAIYDAPTQAQTQAPSMVNRWVTGFTKTEDLAFSKNSHHLKNGGVHRITIRQGTADEVIGNRTFRKNNFENVNLEPNHPDAIIDRAMFKGGVCEFCEK
uniref:Uncharacterized protein n=1 Tax=Panagrolaimus sp. PS1159 TaxID=55785 RepID=A0AC35FYU2_9BILA